MLTKAQITAASSTLDETDMAMIIAIVRISDKYKANPAYYGDLASKVEDADGTIQAKMINAAIDAIEELGIGVIEIDQRRVGGSDGLYYSQLLERNSLMEYIIGVLYPESFESVQMQVDANGNPIYVGDYQVAQREVNDVFKCK
jgi:spore germination protein YaaH